jgi:hypothetical protein
MLFHPPAGLRRRALLAVAHENVVQPEDFAAGFLILGYDFFR